MRASSPRESSRSVPMYLYASDGSLDASVTHVIAAQNKEISSAVKVMSSPVVPRGRGQECHSQPSCSAAVPGPTQIHPPQQQKKEEHKRLIFKSFLEATDPFQCSLSILSPSGDFSQIPGFCFFCFSWSQVSQANGRPTATPESQSEALVLEIF